MGGNALSTPGNRTAVEALGLFMASLSDRLEKEGIKDAAPCLIPANNKRILNGVKASIAERGIPFKGAEGVSGLIFIPRSFSASVRKCMESVLKPMARGCYGQETSLESLKRAISSNERLQDKRIIVFSGMGGRMAERFKKEVGKTARGVVMSESVDYTGRISISIPYAFLDGKMKERIAKAYLSSLVRAYGVSAVKERVDKTAFLSCAAEKSLVNGVDRVVRMRCEGSTRPDFNDYYQIYLINARYVLDHLDGNGIDDPEQKSLLKNATAYIDRLKIDKGDYSRIAKISEQEGHSIVFKDAAEKDLPALGAMENVLASSDSRENAEVE